MDQCHHSLHHSVGCIIVHVHSVGPTTKPSLRLSLLTLAEPSAQQVPHQKMMLLEFISTFQCLTPVWGKIFCPNHHKQSCISCGHKTEPMHSMLAGKEWEQWQQSNAEDTRSKSSDTAWERRIQDSWESLKFHNMNKRSNENGHKKRSARHILSKIFGSQGR